MYINEEQLDRLVFWITERELIRHRRAAGLPKPWSDHWVFQNYHFCNVYREEDRGTKELHLAVKSFGAPVDSLPTIYTAARLFNHAPSLMTYFHNGIDGLKARRDSGEKIFNTAYVVSTCGVSMDKVDYVHEVVHDVSLLKFPPEPTCQQVFNILRTVNGIGSFIGGQIVADLKYTPFLAGAPDWETFAVMGPGSKKGLNLIMGVGTTEITFKDRLTMLRMALGDGIPEMHNQDLQNCLCEYQKFVRYTEDQNGRRRLYAGI
jgi:hypothetical protein